MNAITQEQLDHALSEQKKAGTNRKPLIATLIEQGTIDKNTAFKGLESLIEMTIVEVLTWGSGTFSLDVSKEYVSDEYRYFPEKLNQEILLNAQGVLMDSLRIYDEKMRDGTLSKLFFVKEDSSTQTASVADSGKTEITADQLGLDALDTITRKIPDIFSGLKDHNPVNEHRQVVTRYLSGTTEEHQEQLISFLTSISHVPISETALAVTAVILLTQSELLSHAITVVCRHENLFIYTSDDESGLNIVIEQLLCRDHHPVLVIDIPHDSDGVQALELVKKKVSLYPQISILIATCGHTWRTISMAALASGTRSIIPRPCGQCHDDSFVPRMIEFLSGIGSYMKSILPVPHADVSHHFIVVFNRLKSLTEPPEIALELLRFAAIQFERALTFVVAKSELIAEKSIGVVTEKSNGPTAPLMFRISPEKHSILQKAVENGGIYYGQHCDSTLANMLYKEIGAPRCSKILILPLVSRGKVIALTYADFGGNPVSSPQINLLEALAGHAGSVLDNALYRKSIEKPV